MVMKLESNEEGRKILREMAEKYKDPEKVKEFIESTKSQREAAERMRNSVGLGDSRYRVVK